MVGFGNPTYKGLIFWVFFVIKLFNLVGQINLEKFSFWVIFAINLSSLVWQTNLQKFSFLKNMDSIKLTGIRCYGYTGYLPEEQVLGQWFEVDLTLWLDLRPAGKSDALEDTLDYRKVISTTQNIVKTSKFALVERLAEAIAEAILMFAEVEKIQVSLTKPAAPIPDFGGKIKVEIVREK